MTNDERFKELLTRLHAEVFKPRGWSKEGQNFRFFQPDGLCRIVNFQRSAWNDAQLLSFYINLGVYWESQVKVTNRRFKEHECRVRGRVHGNVEKWNIFEGRDMDKLFSELKVLIEGRVMERFDTIPDREEVLARYGSRGNGFIWL